MDYYGDFSQSISRLESNLSDVRCVWADQTAQTYDHINENMEMFTSRIWKCFCSLDEGYNSLKANYREYEIDNELNRLDSKIGSV